MAFPNNTDIADSLWEEDLIPDIMTLAYMDGTCPQSGNMKSWTDYFLDKNPNKDECGDNNGT